MFDYSLAPLNTTHILHIGTPEFLYWFFNENGNWLQTVRVDGDSHKLGKLHTGISDEEIDEYLTDSDYCCEVFKINLENE